MKYAVIGLGAIGKQVVQRLGGFNCKIIACDPVPDQDFIKEHQVKLVNLDELVKSSDIISLHLPLNAETRNVIDQTMISKMKPGVYLVNTARGGLIDEAALYDGIINEHIAGAALDVFVNQPPGSDHPLMQLPQVIATPHMSSHTDDACNKMGWMALEDCLAVLRGEDPLYRVI